jgi:hypothetical protein
MGLEDDQPVRRWLRERGILRKWLRERSERAKEPQPQTAASESKPESGRSFAEQTQEGYCVECIEGHSMIAATETRHAIDRYRTAGKMTEGVTEKVRIAIQELQGIIEDVRSTENAPPEVKQELDKILDEVRWIRKEYGISGKGLTIGQGELQDLETLRERIFGIQTRTYVLVSKCPSCRKTAQDLADRLQQK